MTNPFVHGPDDWGLTQPGRRTPYNPLDQHRRKWLVSIEMTRRGGPALVGAIIPCFDDPIRTPTQYLALAPGRLDLLEIDYERWARDQEEATREYNERKDEFGREMYGDQYDPDKPVEQLPGRGRELMRLIGKQPLSADVVRRAAAGEKSLLKGEKPQRKPVAKAKAPAPKPPPKFDIQE